MFFGVVLVAFLVDVAAGLPKAWARRHLAQGSDGATGNVAGAVQLGL